MRTIEEISSRVKLMKEKSRVDRPEPLNATSDSQRWTVRCIHLDCRWSLEGLLSEQAARTGGELHAQTPGHHVKLRAVVEFDCGIIRAKSEAGR